MSIVCDENGGAGNQKEADPVPEGKWGGEIASLPPFIHLDNDIHSDCGDEISDDKRIPLQCCQQDTLGSHLYNHSRCVVDAGAE